MLDETRQERGRSRSVDPGGNPGPDRRAGGRRGSAGRSATSARRARSRCSARASSATSSWPSASRGQAGKHVRADGRGEVKDLPMIVKTDVQGSQEALVHAMTSCRPPRCGCKWCMRRSAASRESDVNLAMASKAVIIGFNTRADQRRANWPRTTASTFATTTSFTMRSTKSRRRCRACWRRRKRNTVLGMVEIRKCYKITKIGTVAGCYVLEGWSSAARRSRLLRDNVVTLDRRTGVAQALQG